MVSGQNDCRDGRIGYSNRSPNYLHSSALIDPKRWAAPCLGAPIADVRFGSLSDMAAR